MDSEDGGIRMEWISVKDELPPQNENVILCDGKEIFCGSFEGNIKGNQCWGNQACDGVCYGWYEKGQVTHWMPLPSFPVSK